MTIFKKLEEGYQKSLKKAGVKTLPQYEKAYLEAEKQGRISTITGKPIPTAAEQIHMGKKVAAEALPIAADIAMTVAAPQFKGAQLGLKANSLGIKGINALMRMAGAGTGGAIGEFARQKMMGEPRDIGKIDLQALLGAGTEGIGTLATAGGRRAVRPLVNWTADASQLAKPFARAAVKYQRRLQQEIKEKTTNRMLNFVEKFTGRTPTESGKSIGSALQKETDFTTIYKPWIESVDRIAAENGGVIPLEDSVQEIGELIEKFANNRKSRSDAVNEAISWLGLTGKKDRPMVASIMKDIYEDGYMDPSDVKFLMSKLWKGYGKITAKANNWKEAFKASFLSDLDRFGHGAMEARQIADETAKKVYDFMANSPTSQKILSRMNFGKSDRLYFQEYPNRITEAIFGKTDTLKNMVNSRKDPEAIKQLRKFISNSPEGEEAWTAISFNYISDMIRGSIKQAPDTGKSIILPAELAEKIYQSEDTIKAALPLGTWNRLKKEAQFLSSMANKFDKLDINDGYDIFTSFGILHPKGQKIIEKIGKGAQQTGKVLLKTVGHTLGPPALMSTHGSK